MEAVEENRENREEGECDDDVNVGEYHPNPSSSERLSSNSNSAKRDKDKRRNVNHFARLPLELKLQIFSNLKLFDWQNSRLVSHDWATALSFSLNHQFRAKLQNTSAFYVENSPEYLEVIEIKRLSRIRHRHLSAKYGLGLKMCEARKITVFGYDETDPDILTDLMGFSRPYVREVELRNVSDQSCLNIFQPYCIFEWLQNLTISFYDIPDQKSYIVLDRLSSGLVFIPQLKFLKIIHEVDEEDAERQLDQAPTFQLNMDVILDNYLATMRTILNFRSSLQEVYLVRTRSTRLLMFLNALDAQAVVEPYQRNEIERMRDEIALLNLRKLRVDMFHCEGVYPFVLESALFTNRVASEFITCKRGIAPPEQYVFNPNIFLSDFLPCKSTPQLTQVSVKFISHPFNQPFDLAPIRHLPCLRYLSIFYDNDSLGATSIAGYKNVWALPKTLQCLSLGSYGTETWETQQVRLLSYNQLVWIVENLQNLSDFFTQVSYVNHIPMPEPFEFHDPLEQDDNDEQVPQPVPDQLQENPQQILEENQNQVRNHPNSTIDPDLAKRFLLLPKMRKFDLQVFNSTDFGNALARNGDGRLAVRNGHFELRLISHLDNMLRRGVLDNNRVVHDVHRYRVEWLPFHSYRIICYIR